MGERLIVAVQGDQMLTHSGNPHHFPAQERALGLAWLHIVNGVLILDRGDLAEAIQLLKPNSLVLGKEFEKDRQGQLKESLKYYEPWGKSSLSRWEVHYATTDLLREEPRDLQRDRWQQFQQACQRQQLDLEQLNLAEPLPPKSPDRTWRYHRRSVHCMRSTRYECRSSGVSSSRTKGARISWGSCDCRRARQFIGSKVPLSLGGRRR